MTSTTRDRARGQGVDYLWKDTLERMRFLKPMMKSQYVWEVERFRGTHRYIINYMLLSICRRSLLQRSRSTAAPSFSKISIALNASDFAPSYLPCLFHNLACSSVT